MGRPKKRPHEEIESAPEDEEYIPEQSTNDSTSESQPELDDTDKETEFEHNSDDTDKEIEFILQQSPDTNNLNHDQMPEIPEHSEQANDAENSEKPKSSGIVRKFTKKSVRLQAILYSVLNCSFLSR